VPVLAALIPAALVDWRVQHLPTRLLSVAGAVLLLGMVLAWLGPQVAPAGIDDVATPLRAGDLLRALGGGALVYIALAALSLLPQLWGRAPGIGMGDANLYVVLGPLLALHGWSTLLMGLYLGFFFGGLVALALLLSGRLKLKGRIAFWPWVMAGGAAGAMCRRAEDGIVLVDQDQCRGWRMCVSACPYKKVYFNHNTGKAEKCTLCYPRLEVGQPTICSETCVGRLRYLGVLLYDADRVTWAASQEDERDLYRAQREILLDPNDPQVVAQAQANGVPHSWITAAQQSPIWKLITEYEVALPLHPEFRTLPMVWYVPPLSPVVDQVTASGSDGEDHKVLLSAISQMRIPLEYLAGLFTAGDTAPVELALRRLAAMRSYMRDVFVDNPTNEEIPASVGMTPEKVKEMYRLLSIAKYDDRFVIPTAHPEMPRGIKELEGCPVSYDVEAFHGLAPATSNRPMGGSSPEGRQMLPLEVVR